MDVPANAQSNGDATRVWVSCMAGYVAITDVFPARDTTDDWEGLVCAKLEAIGGLQHDFHGSHRPAELLVQALPLHQTGKRVAVAAGKSLRYERMCGNVRECLCVAAAETRCLDRHEVHRSHLRTAQKDVIQRSNELDIGAPPLKSARVNRHVAQR